jgi:hypothetical protein
MTLREQLDAQRAQSRERLPAELRALMDQGTEALRQSGLAHLYNLIPYQRRALNMGKCGVEVEGGRVPTSDWMLNLQILTSGGYQCAPAPPHH